MATSARYLPGSWVVSESVCILRSQPKVSALNSPTNVIPGLVPGTHWAAHSARWKDERPWLHSTLYIGVTNDLHRRMLQHREARAPGFTMKYHVTMLMYFEEFAHIADAILREKSLKERPRAWKINLIERDNPHWQDLIPVLFDAGSDTATSLPSIEMGPGHKARDDS